MDFAFTEEQTALGDLTRRLCDEHVTPEAWRRIEQPHLPAPAGAPSAPAPARWLPELWQALAASELLGVALPAAVGGAGLGLLELGKVLEALGGAAAPVPAWATLALAAPALARYGTPAHHELLRGVCRGDTILTAALVEQGDPVEARPDGAGFLLVGVCDAVPAGTLASHVLVPARTPGGQTVVALVAVGAPGVEVAAQVGTSEEPLARLTLRGARVGADDLLNGTDGAPVVAQCRAWGLVGQAALQLGVVSRALRFTAQHAAERHQFDRPIGTFQAVAQRVGDAYVDVETLRLVTWRAAWLIDAGRPHEREVLVAKYWAAECGHRVVSAAQHIHGGLGFDRDYPLFRYYLLAKQLEFTLGGATAQLSRLGTLLASPP